MAALRELILVEEFKLLLPLRLPLTAPLCSGRTAEPQQRPAARFGERRCFFCLKPGHLIAECLDFERQKQNPPAAPAVEPKGVGLIHTGSGETVSLQREECCDRCFKPFVSEGWVSPTGEPDDQNSIQLLRDTACSQSVILSSTLPFSPGQPAAPAQLQGGDGSASRSVHLVHLRSSLVSGVFPVAVCPALPIRGITMLLGNDIAGGKVEPVLEALDIAPVGEPVRAQPRCFPPAPLYGIRLETTRGDW